jgi:hypothetical protein
MVHEHKVSQCCWVAVSCMEIGALKTILCCRVCLKFCHYLVRLSPDLGRDDHNNLFRGCEFHKKWHSGSHISHRSVMGLLSYFPHLLFDWGEAGCKRSAHRGRVVRSPRTAESKGRQIEDFK